VSAQLKDPLLGFRPMRKEDLQQVQAIEALSYDFPWTLGIFRDCLRVGYCCWVVTLEARVIGYGVMSVALDECHLLNLCIHPAWRRYGLARKMVRRLLNLAKQHGAETAFLEARISNHGAITLYRQLGFVEVGRRRNYYPHQEGREDALVLSLTL
jgi:ribosomal-protein-alanine N-acetyltransferase